MAALDRIMCTAIAVMEFVVGQMGFEADASWRAPVLQPHAETPYQVISHRQAESSNQTERRLLRVTAVS